MPAPNKTAVTPKARTQVQGISSLPLLPLLIRPAISALFFGLLLLPSQWFFSVLTLAYLDLKGQVSAAME